MNNDTEVRIPLIPKIIPCCIVRALSEVVDWGQLNTNVSKYQKRENTLGEGVKVAVLDSGVETNHSDLRDNIGKAIDFTGCGEIDTIGHGTHVAGIIAACANGIGVIGVAPKSKLYSARVLDNNGHCPNDYRWVVSGIEWAIDNKVDIINMSLGSKDKPREKTGVHKAIQKAVENNIIIVTAAGNDGSNILNWPARYKETISVAAMDENGILAEFSNYGEDLDCVAPGVDIHSTWIGDNYTLASGTSMAAPFISGVLALLISAHKNNPSKTPIKGRNDAVLNLKKFETEKPVATKTGKSIGVGILDLGKVSDDEDDVNLQDDDIKIETKKNIVGCIISKINNIINKIKELIS